MVLLELVVCFLSVKCNTEALFGGGNELIELLDVLVVDPDFAYQVQIDVFGVRLAGQLDLFLF